MPYDKKYKYKKNKKIIEDEDFENLGKKSSEAFKEMKKEKKETNKYFE